MKIRGECSTEKYILYVQWFMLNGLQSWGPSYQCDLTIHYSDFFIDVRGSGEPIYVITSVIPKKGNNTHHLQRHTFHASPTQRLKNILRYHPNHRYFGRQLRILNNSFINLEKKRKRPITSKHFRQSHICHPSPQLIAAPPPPGLSKTRHHQATIAFPSDHPEKFAYSEKTRILIRPFGSQHPAC